MTSTSGIRGFMNNVITAREQQAKRYVNSILLSMDEATLTAAGYDRAELKKRPSTTLPF